MTVIVKARIQNSLKNLLISKNIPVDNAEIESMSRKEMKRKIKELK